jgi:nucleotide-binding universal stress UspA family protein
MNKSITKSVAAPVDGSEYAKQALAYLSHMFEKDKSFHIILCYILPTLPPILVEESRKSAKTAKKLAEIEDRNVQMAKKILSESKELLVEKGFKENQIETLYRKKEIGTARDICILSENKRVDALAIATRGRSKLESFFFGEVANKVLEFHRASPVWLIKGAVKSKNVLLAVDSSENALRAADHASFMLSGLDSQIVLFHSKRNLRRFVPKELLKTAPELEDLWRQTAGQEIAAYMDKAKAMLLSAGIPEDRISIKVVDGSRNPANDIMKAAEESECGTIVLGRKGFAKESDFSMGDVARKVLGGSVNKAVWVVL